MIEMGRKKEVQKSQEELVVEKLDREIREKRDGLCLVNEPTYFFNIGDKVNIGNLENVVVSAVYNDGKIYEITYSSTHTNYGNPYQTHGHKLIVYWMDIRKTNDSKESLIQNIDLRLNYSQRDLGDILSKVFHFGVNFEPDYQRDYVWELEDKVSLVDSIFNNIDIGKFVFIRKNYTNERLYEVLDGKQRINAILDFYEDRFQYKGKYFSDLSYRDQNHFEGYTVNIAEISDITPKQVLQYFLMVNKTGRVMSKEQLVKVEKMLEEMTNEEN
jgi:hypothetical protein